MNWKELLSTKRQRTSTSEGRRDLRSEFEKDYHRIIGSASFRRLQDKTQVFPLDTSDFIRTRLTHSLEVSSFARSLGQTVGASIVEQGLDPDFGPQEKDDISDILQCAGLVHDIGNPPFGHFGEICIRQWFRDHLDETMYKGKSLREWLTPQMCEDLCQFEGNAQVLRLLTRLHFLIDENGMNLTYALLSTIIKYPVSSLEADRKSSDSSRKKMGYFYSEEDLFRDIEASTGLCGKRSPLTYLLEAADDIAYATADIEDAYKKGFIRYRDLQLELQTLGTDTAHPALAILSAQYEKGLEKQPDDPELYAVLNWTVRLQGYLLEQAADSFMAHYDEIMAGRYEKDLFYGTEVEQLIALLCDMGWRYVFDSPAIYKMELRTAEVYEYLLDKFVQAVLYYETDEWEEKRRPTDHKLMTIISENYKRAYHHLAAGKSEAEQLYLRLLLVTDCISGMTDSYARDFYQEIRGIRS